jgi:hypothetical protein
MMLRRRGSLVLSCVVLLGACGSDSSPTQSDESGSISAVIGGEAWSVTPPAVGAHYYDSIQLFRISTVDFDAAYRMTITLGAFEGEGTYEIRPGIPPRIAEVVAIPLGGIPGWGSDYAATPGVITITNLTDTRVQGTFSFTAEPAPGASVTGTLVIEQGEFDVPLTRVED